MKTRGTRGGILLSLDAEDTLEHILGVLEEHQDLLEGKVSLEVGERVAWEVIEALAGRVREAGGELLDVRPPQAVVQAKGETVILARTVRSGGRVDSSGSIVILGDVNSGAELIANDDIIVVGKLRGVAHAGASGNESAVIWAQEIASPQLRIGGALARAGSSASRGAELAHLRNGQIVLTPWDKQSS